MPSEDSVDPFDLDEPFRGRIDPRHAGLRRCRPAPARPPVLG